MSDSHEPFSPAVTLSDRDLDRRNYDLGKVAKRGRRHFLATLPEMERRGLTEKHGGVFALAAKRGSEEASKVRAALALARRLERFPRIWALYEQEGIGTSVIQRVPIEFLEEDEEVWEEILRSHSRSQVDELVKAERARRAPAPDPEPDPAPGPDPSADASEDDDQLPGQGRLSWGGAGKDGDLEEGTGEEADAAGGLSGHAGNPHPERKSSSKTTGAASSKRKRTVAVELSEEELARLRVVQRERSKAEGRPVSQGEALRMSFLENFLDTRPPGESPATPEERARIRRKAEEAAVKATGTHVPRDVRRELRVRSKGICERPGCSKPAENIHHQIPFRARRSRLGERLRDLPRHHPLALGMLCVDCHTLHHEGWIENPEDPVGEWKIAAVTERRDGLPQDQRYRKERKAARSGEGPPGGVAFGAPSAGGTHADLRGSPS